MKDFLIKIYFLTSLCRYCSSDFSCNTHATVFRHIWRDGFHVDISYTIELLVEVEDAARWENCTFALREYISDSFYVNPDQLSNLHRSGLLNACTLDKIDTEAPQHLSKRLTVYVYGHFQKSQNLIHSTLKMPLHLRYHLPRHGGGYSVAEIKAPTLLVQCEDIVECRHLMKTKAPCFYCSQEICNWMRIPYQINIQNFTMPVPVGDLNHLNIVTVITYLLTFGGCIYVVLSLLDNSKAKDKQT